MIHKNKFLLIGNAMFFLFHIQFLTPAEIRGENLSKKNSFFQKKLFPSIIPSILTAVSTYSLSKKTPALSPRVSCFLALSCGAIPLFIKKLYNCVLKKKENDKIEKIFFFLYAAPSIFQYYETINISANIKYSLIIGYGILKMYIQEPEPESEEELPAEPKDKNHSIIPAIEEEKEEEEEEEEEVPKEGENQSKISVIKEPEPEPEPEPKEEKEEDQFAEYKKNQAKKYALRPEPIEIKKVGKDFGTQISTYQIYVWNAIKPNIPFDTIPLTTKKDIYEKILPLWCPDALDPETFPAQIFLFILFYNNLHLPCTENRNLLLNKINLKTLFDTLSDQTKQRLILLSTLARNESLRKKNISLSEISKSEISKMEEYKTQETVIYDFLKQDIAMQPAELLLSLCTHIVNSDDNGESKILKSLENTFGKPSLDHAKTDALKKICESIQNICMSYSLDSDEQKIKNIQDTINKKLNINLEDNKKFLDKTSSLKKSQLYNSFMEILMNPLIKFFDFKTLPIQLFLMMLLQIKLHISCTNTKHICDIEKWDFEYSSLLWSDADKIRLIYNTAGAIKNNNIIEETRTACFL